MKNNEISSSILGVMGISLSVQDLTQIVNLVLLVLSVINILWVLCSKVYTHVKKKEYEKISEDITEAQDELKKLEGGDKNV